MDSKLKKVYWLEITNILLAIFGGLILGNIGTYIKLILFIGIVFILENWIQSIPTQADKPPLLDRTKKSFLIMKIGAIYALLMTVFSTYIQIPGILGSILLYLGQLMWAFGLMKIGDEIVASNIILSSSSSIQIEPSFNQTPYSSYGAQPNQASQAQTQSHNTSTSFHSPSSMDEKKCKFCGTPLIDKESSFCSLCGGKLK